MPQTISRRTMLLGMALVALPLATPAWAQTRTLQTTFGPVEIPARPARVVTTHNIATQPLIELGVVPVGRGEVDQSNVSPENWAPIADVPVVTTGEGEPNYEQIALLEPDLIFEINYASEDRVARLRQIAPVVLIGIAGADRARWQNRARQIADAVGALDRFEANEAGFVARQAEIAARYGALAAENPILIWDIWDLGHPAVFPSNTMVGRILAPVGAVFARGAESLASETGEEVEISDEQIGTVFGDARVIFYGANFDLSSYPEIEKTRKLPNYQRLDAVQAGREFALGKLTIAGYADARAVLETWAGTLASLAG